MSIVFCMVVSFVLSSVSKLFLMLFNSVSFSRRTKIQSILYEDMTSRKISIYKVLKTLSKVHQNDQIILKEKAHFVSIHFGYLFFSLCLD